jgi:hypothetical protein
MNEIEGRYEILKAWEKVKRVKKLYQQSYNEIAASIGYIIKYSKIDDIPIPNIETLEII